MARIDPCGASHACLDDALGCVVCQTKSRESLAARRAVDAGLEPCLGCTEPSRCSRPCPVNSRIVTEYAPINVLAEADKLTGNGGDRHDSYDHPRNNFGKIAKGWELIFDTPVTPRQVALAMIVVKVVRDSHSAKRDNLVDIAGYARCAERLDEDVPAKG